MVSAAWIMCQRNVAVCAIAGFDMPQESFDILALPPVFGGAMLRLPNKLAMHAHYLGVYITNRQRVARLLEAVALPHCFDSYQAHALRASSVMQGSWWTSVAR